MFEIEAGSEMNIDQCNDRTTDGNICFGNEEIKKIRWAKEIMRTDELTYWSYNPISS